MYNGCVDINQRADAFKALGDPTRLRIFEFLRACSCEVTVGDSGEVRTVDGPTAGAVCCHVTGIDKVTSTISFHLKELRNAGLIRMEKRGKHMVCSVNREAERALADYLTDPAGCC